MNLAEALARQGLRVLLVDLDPQGHATLGSGIDKRALRHAGYEVLMGRIAAAEVLVDPARCGYRLLPGSGDLTAAEVELQGQEQRGERLRAALEPLLASFDCILIDCPPALGLLTLNALVAADAVLVPVPCDFYALEGLSALMETVERVRLQANPWLDIAGLVRTLYDGRSRLTQDVSAELLRHFGPKLLSTVIPRNVRLAEAPSHGLPALVYDPACAGAQAYVALARELLGHASTMTAHRSTTQETPAWQ